MLLRRTRLGLLAAREVSAAGHARAGRGALGAELGWVPGETATQIESFLAEAAAEGIAVEMVPA